MYEEELVSTIKKRLMEKLEYKEDVSDEELKDMIGVEIKDCNSKEHIPIKNRLELGRQIYHSMRKLDILQDLLEDPGITEPCTLMKIPAEPRRNRAFQRLSNF